MSNERGELPTLARRALGVVFLLGVVGFLVFTVLVYRQVFTQAVHVDLRAERAGSQLVPHADVKIRGVRVGEVRSVDAAADGVTLRLALDPDHTHMVPSNVTARLLSKTLFGERYVDLLMPARPADAIENGDVIHEDRSKATVELNRVLDNLMPLLTAVKPDQLATTLTLTATALDDNGERLGAVLVKLDRYLGELNPSVPELTENLRSLAELSDVYADAAPDLLRGLDDLSRTSRTVLRQQDDLQELLITLTTTADDAREFLVANGDNVVDLAKVSRPTLRLLARYAPEFPCFYRQLDDIRGRLDEVWGKEAGDHKLHLNVAIVQPRGKYQPGRDEPRYADKRGPACYSYSGRAPQHPPGGKIKDGSTEPPAGPLVKGEG
ncbi:MCE family protein [Haloechinothrix halophila]|uniref:MCE family protein n=1 Tax=Haloechinothrix halophila TaxID=1069073 RepID=UPI00041FC70A|nr:MCE family protein [Haloechinothrix halophila]